MHQFEFEAKTRDGGRERGMVNAQSRTKAAKMLSNRDLFVVTLNQSDQKKHSSLIKPNLSRNELAWQIWQLSLMIETGMGLSEAMGCLARQATRLPAKVLLEDIEKRVREGASLSEAMDAHPASFPCSIRALIRASELSGMLKNMLRHAAIYLMNDLKTVRKMRGAMIYPLMMILICIGVTVFLLTFVLPRFAGVFASQGRALPLPTQMMMGASEFLMGNVMTILIAVVGSVVFGTLWIKSESGRRTVDRILVSLPVISRPFNAMYQSRGFSAMAIMLESHVQLIEAIPVVRESASNILYNELWRDVEEQARIGERLAAPLLHAEFIPESIAQVIDNGDRSGQLSVVFAHLAEFMEEEFNRSVNDLLKLIEPIMIIVMGGVIAFIAISLMLPLVQASQGMAG